MIIGFVVDIAGGSDGSPYAALGAIGGLSYLAAGVVCRVRGLTAPSSAGAPLRRKSFSCLSSPVGALRGEALPAAALRGSAARERETCWRRVMQDLA